jgi:hypothetical protein
MGTLAEDMRRLLRRVLVENEGLSPPPPPPRRRILGYLHEASYDTGNAGAFQPPGAVAT